MVVIYAKKKQLLINGSYKMQAVMNLRWHDLMLWLTQCTKRCAYFLIKLFYRLTTKQRTASPLKNVYESLPPNIYHPLWDAPNWKKQHNNHAMMLLTIWEPLLSIISIKHPLSLTGGIIYQCHYQPFIQPSLDLHWIIINHYQPQNESSLLAIINH